MNDGTNAGVLTGYTIPGAVAQPGGGAAPLAFTPVTGLWWNPIESGTGYNIQIQHGVMVATMYTYTAGATRCGTWPSEPNQCGGGVAATGTLDKYRSGQCASCMYQMPSMMGNDGGMTITSRRQRRRRSGFPVAALPRFSPTRGN